MRADVHDLRVSELSDTHATVLSWSGRIDNAADLLDRLRTSKKWTRDAPAIVLGIYRQEGIAGLARVVGDWSVAIADAPRQQIVLASDFAGVRPLFYHRDGARLRWSSSLSALADAVGALALDELWVGGFLTVGGYPNRTPYRGISSVPPGHAVRVTAAGAVRERFWRMPTDACVAYGDERAYEEELRSLFLDAVRVRMDTRTAVVCELSGGLDSSSVVGAAHDVIKRRAVPARRLTTISYVYDGSSDLSFIRDVEAHCGLTDTHHLHTDQYPLASAGEVATDVPEGWTALRDAAADVVKGARASTVLTGQGGDLMMGNWFNDSLQVAAPLRRGRIGQAAREAHAWSRVTRTPAAAILWRAAIAAAPSFLANASFYAGNGEPRPKAAGQALPRDLFPREFLDRVGLREPVDVLSGDWKHARPERRKHFHALTAMLELRLLQVPPALDGVDYTHPFMHRPLVEFVMGVPAHVLCRPGEPRRLMRRALCDLWPASLTRRRSKSLFGGPWSTALLPLVQRLRGARAWHVVDRGWVSREGLTTHLERSAHGLGGNGTQLRQIVLLEYWLRARAHTRETACGVA